MLTILLVIISYLLTVASNNNKFLLPDEDNDFNKCLSDISVKYFDDYSSVMIFSQSYKCHDEIYLKWTVYIQSFKKLKNISWTTSRKIDNYILIVENLKTFQSVLLKLKKYGWNSMAKFVILIQNANKIDIFEELWRHKIINAVVIVPEDTLKDANIFIWFPYLGDNCGKDYNVTSLVGVCQNRSLISYENLFPSKIPENLHNCEFIVRAIDYPPYVIVPESEAFRSSPIVFMDLTDGVEIIIMNTLAKKLNFQVIYSATRDVNGWGFILENGTAGGMMKSILEEEVDMGISCLEATIERGKFYEISVSYITELLLWSVPTAQLEPKWKCLINVFQLQIWLMIIIVYIAASIAVYIIGILRKNESTSYKKLTSCCSNTFSSLLSISIKTLPESTFLRSFYILWLIFGFHLSASFNTFLIGVLTNPNYEKQITTIEEIIERNLTLGLAPVDVRYFDDENSWIENKIRNTWVNCLDGVTCISRIAFNRDLSFANAQHYILYVLQEEKYRNPSNNQPLVYLFKEPIVHFTVHMLGTKGFPLMPTINMILIRMLEGGLIDKMFEDVLRNSTHSKHSNKASEDDSRQVLTLVHLQGAFLVLSFGLCTSVLVFISEIALFKRNNKFRQI